MSLRARLTLLYTTLLGGILLFFGVIVYLFVSYLLVQQIDENLISTFDNLLNKTEMKDGNLDINQPASRDLMSNVFAQAWDRRSQLQYSSIPNLNTPFDPYGLQATQPVFRNLYFQDLHLRVLSVPLIYGGRPVGVMQVASDLAVVDATLRTLVTVLLVGILVAVGLASLIFWLSTRRAFAPLEAVTQTALQISRADDLSRRIQYRGPPNDEIGQLILAFNQTLGRLENLFNTQRRFLADVGHELRTPLTVIKGNVDLMRRMENVDEESLTSIDNEVSRLTRLVGDLLLLAQAESGKLPLDWRLVELDTLVLEAMQQMSVLARDRIDLRLGDIDQVLVCGDQDRLKQVLVNLIGNAIQYTPNGGEVMVGLGKFNDQARLTIRDNGPGIPAEDLPHVFERFYRGEKSRTRSREGKGFGLGLSIAYWIVRNHGGRIEVDSKEGVGTTFGVWLPLSKDGCKK